MAKNINKVKVVDVAAVAGNNTLAAGVDRRAVERCKDAIERLGVLHTPVIGTTHGGNRLLLSGQCELMALRELGVKKMEAIEVGVADDAGTMAKLSLMLISLKDKPGALCEGLLLQEAVDAGVPRSEIQIMLGKSASWVSNRISLVTRLDSNVYKMVRDGLLDPRSAEEISRLPTETQFAFAETAVRECLPKSSIESLVVSYNDKTCPDVVKAQILNDPRSALRRVADNRRAVKTDNQDSQKAGMPPHVVEECVKAVRAQVERLYRILKYVSPLLATGYIDALNGLDGELHDLRIAIRKFIYPGKTEVSNNAG